MTFHRTEKWLVNFILYGSMAGILTFFYIPIFTMVAFSFKETNYMIFPFGGFSLQWYEKLFEHVDFYDAVTNSFLIAFFTTIIATVLGTIAALAWVRYRFKLRSVFQSINLLPIIFPQLILGIMFLLWFSVLGNAFEFNTGIVTVIIGHVVYLAPFAMVVVSVQIHAFDDTLEDAARDAGATIWQVYRDVTLPLIWPGIFSAAIFVFLLSWGNFYITFYLNGGARTIPTFVFAGLTQGSIPIYPALATLVFIPGIVLVAVAEHYRRRALARL